MSPAISGSATACVVSNSASVYSSWRAAAREPQFAEYAHEQRELAVAAVRDLMALRSGDEMMDHWSAESAFGWLIEAVLTWLEVGEADRDEEFVDRATAALRAMRTAW